MAKLDRKQWNRLGREVEKALTIAEQDQAVRQQAVFLGDILLNMIKHKLDELGRKRESLPGATYILAGLHIFHSLTDAVSPLDETERQARVAEAMEQLLQEADQHKEAHALAPVLSLEERSKQANRKGRKAGKTDSEHDS